MFPYRMFVLCLAASVVGEVSTTEGADVRNWKRLKAKELYEPPFYHNPSGKVFYQALRNLFLLTIHRSLSQQEHITWYSVPVAQMFPTGIHEMRVGLADCLLGNPKQTPPLCQSLDVRVAYHDWYRDHEKGDEQKNREWRPPNILNKLNWHCMARNETDADTPNNDSLPLPKTHFQFGPIKPLDVFDEIHMMYWLSVSWRDHGCDAKTVTCDDDANDQLVVVFEFDNATWIEQILNSNRTAPFGQDFYVIFVAPDSAFSPTEQSSSAVLHKHEWSNTYLLRVRNVQQPRSDAYEEDVKLLRKTVIHVVFGQFYDYYALVQFMFFCMTATLVIAIRAADYDLKVQHVLYTSLAAFSQSVHWSFRRRFRFLYHDENRQ